MPLDGDEYPAQNRELVRQPAKSQSRQQLLGILHLFVLVAFAVAQPVFDRVGERPAFLNDMGVKRPTIVLLAVVFSLIVPAALAAAIYGLGRVWPRARAPVQAVVVYTLLTLAFAPLTYGLIFLPDWLAIGVAVVTGAAATGAYYAFSKIRAVVTAAAPAIVIFPCLFLLLSPVGRMFFLGVPKIEATRWHPVPVVVVVLDELCGRTLVNDRLEIDSVRFPHFAELARGSTWFPNATSVYPTTFQAVPALISGRYPSTTWPPTVADRPQNLFSVLHALGEYELAIFEPVSRLAPDVSRDAPAEDANVLEQFLSILPAVGRVLLFHVTPADLRTQLPQVPRLWFGMHDAGTVDPEQRRGVFRYGLGDDRLEQFEHFLNCIDDSPRPQLYFKHLILPHFPWCYLPSGRKYIGDMEWKDLHHHEAVDDELFVAHCQQRHLLQVAFVDTQIGRLVARLREAELYDKCLLVVAADHGISFQTGAARREPDGTSRADVMSVPLFIKTPGQQTGAVSGRNVETVDILPTIADVLGIQLQLPVDGRSVFEAGTERSAKTWHTPETLGKSPQIVPADVLETCDVPQMVKRRFGSPSDPDAVYRVGPHPELVGRRVTDVAQAAVARSEISLRSPGSIYSSDRAALVPCFIQGRVVAPRMATEPVKLAVAINGIIRTTTRTYQIDGLRDCFSALVPESAFHEGANDVRYFTIDGVESAIRLTPCLISGPGESKGPGT